MSGIRKIILFTLIAVISLLNVSCKDNTGDHPELDINTSKIIDDDIAESQGEWIQDPTGYFSYLSINPGVYFQIVFDESMVFPGNMFIYEANTPSVDDVKLYGYMDTNFKKLTEPISLEPNIFMYGLARIQTEDSSYIVNNRFEKIEEYYPGYILCDNSLIEVNWTQRFYSEPYIVNNINFNSYIVPYRIESDPENNLLHPVVGYKTLQDAYFNNTPAEDKFIIPAVFQEANLFYDGIAAVKANDKWGFIDQEGNFVVECKYDDAVSLTHGVAAVCQKVDYSGVVTITNGVVNDQYNERWALIDTEGNQLTPLEHLDVRRFIDGVAAIGIESRMKFYNASGEQLTNWLSNKSGDPPVFHEGYIAMYGADYSFHFYDKTGSVAFPGGYNSANNFSDGYAAVYNRGIEKWGYINTSGERIIPYTYSVATDFSRGYAYVSEGKAYVTQGSSETFYPPGYIIDKFKNEYLKDLNLLGMTKFNEEGYALAYSIEVNEYWVNVNAGRKDLKPKWVIEIRDDKICYMIHIE